jgi:hypothetical protein
MRKIVGKVISGQGLATGFLKETFFEEVLGFPPYELSIRHNFPAFSRASIASATGPM